MLIFFWQKNCIQILESQLTDVLVSRFPSPILDPLSNSISLSIPISNSIVLFWIIFFTILYPNYLPAGLSTWAWVSCCWGRSPHSARPSRAGPLTGAVLVRAGEYRNSRDEGIPSPTFAVSVFCGRVFSYCSTAKLCKPNSNDIYVRNAQFCWVILPTSGLSISR